MIRVLRFSLVLVIAGAVSLTAQGSANARFQYERAAEVTGSGPQRLDVDVPLLTGSQPFIAKDFGGRSLAHGGLGDLRLFDSNNVEVPYLLIEPTFNQPTFGGYAAMAIPAVEKQDNKTSGFEVDTRAVRLVDAIVLNGIPAPFLKRFRLEGSGDRERWTDSFAKAPRSICPSSGCST